MAEFLSPVWEFLFDKLGMFGLMIAASSPLIVIGLIVLLIVATVRAAKAHVRRQGMRLMKQSEAYAAAKDWDNAFLYRKRAFEKVPPTPEDLFVTGKFCHTAKQRGWENTAPDTEEEYWFKKAAAQNHVEAKSSLAIARHESLATAGDYLAAAKEMRNIYSLAKDEGSKFAKEYVTETQTMREETIEGDELSTLYLRATFGDVESQTHLGFAWTKADMATALEWLELAGKNGNTDAQSQCGDIYKEGQNGITPDREKAMDWYRKAAHNGDKHSMFQLAVLYSESRASMQDLKQAVYWFEKLAVDNNAVVEHNLCFIYYRMAELVAEQHGVTDNAEKLLIAEYRRYIECAHAWMEKAEAHEKEEA